jgi:hypothetical protein
MELDFKELNELVNDAKILPGINDLVDVLYTENLNEFLDKKNETQDDRRVIMMFIMMYFYSYISVPREVKNYIDVKQTLKAFLSDLIRDKDKRLICVNVYKNFEDSLKLMNVEMENKVKEIKED